MNLRIFHTRAFFTASYFALPWLTWISARLVYSGTGIVTATFWANSFMLNLPTTFTLTYTSSTG